MNPIQHFEPADWRGTFIVFLGAVFGITFSIALGETLLGIVLLILIIKCFKRRRLPVFTTEFVFAAVFAAWAAVTVWFGVDRAEGFSDLSRLAWFLVIPVAATLINDFRRARAYLEAFVAGCLVLSVYLMSCNVVEAVQESGEEQSFFRALVNAGSMTDGQMLVMGILATIALLSAYGAQKWLWVASALQLAAIVVNFKRGSWLVLIVLGFLFLVLERKWKSVLVGLCLVLVAISLPQVRSRMGSLKGELDLWGGGRLTMWTKVAPQLASERTWTGVGYGSMSENVMQAAAARRWREENPGTTPPSRLVEPDRDHLHSNPVQVLSATGFPGLAIYLLWMLVMVIRAVATAWTVRRRDRRKGVLMVALALMIISVLLNGLVEYNFGDTELLIVLGSLMGVTGGLRRGIGS